MMLFSDILASRDSISSTTSTRLVSTLNNQESMNRRHREVLHDRFGATQSKTAIPNVTNALEDRPKMLERLRRPELGINHAAENNPTTHQNQVARNNESPEIHDFLDYNRAPAPNGYDENHLSIENQHNHIIIRDDQRTAALSADSDDLTSLRRSTSSETLRPKSTGSYETAFRWSLLPAPLDPKKSLSTSQQDQHSLVPPARIYGGARGKIQEQLGVDDVQVGFSFLEPPTPDIHQSDTTPRPPTRTWRSSFNRLSLTPSEIPYPINLIREYDPTDHRKAEEMLGLRRHSQAPPVPPKNFARSSTSNATSSNGEGSLPLHKETIEPLNGRTAWLHALTAILIVFNCWGLCNAFGLFQAYYERDYLSGTSPSAISWIASVQLALVFGLGVPVGRLVDKGYFRLMFHGGSALLILGLFCSALCKQFWQLLLVQGCLTGLGMGMTCCAGIVALMTWWDEWKIGSAMGLAAAGSCIGGIVYVLLARHFLQTRGFKTTMLILGGVAAATMIPPNLVFRIRGQKYGSKSRQWTKSSLNWRTFAELSYLLAAGGMLCSFLGVYFGFVYIISFASTELHLSDQASTNLLIFMLAANLPGRFLPALISDRCIGPLNTIIPSVFLSSAVIWLWAASGERRESLTVIACFYGFVSAGIQVLYAPTVYTFCLESVKSASSTEDTQLAMDRIGLKAGGIFTSIGVGCLIGLPIGGALINYRTERGMSQPYLGAQIFAGVSLLLGGCLLLGSRVAKTGWAAKRA